jgi:DNA repair exonuclease SbcCD ATPase subunit
MKDEEKTRAQLVEELEALRQEVAELRACESQYRQAEKALQEKQRFIQQIADVTPNILYLDDILEERNVYTNNGVTAGRSGGRE